MQTEFESCSCHYKSLFLFQALASLKEMLAHKDMGVFSLGSNTADDLTLISPVGVFSPHDGKLKQYQSQISFFH